MWASHHSKPIQALARPVFSPLTNNRGENKVTQEAVSPDGTMIAYADDFGITLQIPATGVARALSPMQPMDVHRIDWVPDQTHLLVSGTDRATHREQVVFLPMDSVYSSVLAEDADHL